MLRFLRCYIVNILNGAKISKQMGINLITLSGFNKENPLRKLGNLNLWVNYAKMNPLDFEYYLSKNNNYSQCLQHRQQLEIEI